MTREVNSDAATLPAFLNRSVQAGPRIVSPTEINVSLLLKNLSSPKLMTVMLNYEVLSGIYRDRREHKLDEWRAFCRWIEELPHSELITCK